jgi:D-proline reductase (dithiol) PrdB
VAVDRLCISHFGYPTGDAEDDANCVFPLDPLRKLVRDGVLGDLAPTAIGVMGGIYSRRRVVVETAPAVVEVLRAEQVDLLFAVPA